MIEAGDDALMGDQGFGEGQLRCDMSGEGRRGVRGSSRPPQRLIEAMEDGFGRFLGVEPPLEACARQIVELADALQAKAPQEPRGCFRKAQGLDGERRKRRPDLSVQERWLADKCAKRASA